MKKNNHLFKIFFMVIIFLLVIFVVKKYTNVGLFKEIDHNKKIIFFGQTCDLQNNQVSIDYSTGFQLAFKHINDNGGINGYKLKIFLLNDKYETSLAITNAKILIDYYNVLAIIGTFGTPTTVGIFDNVINERKIPLIAPFTAGTSYRKKFNKFRIYMNSNFYLEFDLLIENLLKNNYKNISVIYQNDIYGNYFYNALIDYFFEKKTNINIISSGNYERNSDDITESLKSTFNTDSPYNYNSYKKKNLEKIQAVVLFTAEKEVSSYLGQLKKIKPSMAIYYNFFTGTQKSNFKYIKVLNKDNIYQTLLSIDITKYPKLNKVFNQIRTINKTKNNGSSMVQGFYSGLMIGEVLKNFKNVKQVNRNSFINMFYKMKYINVYGLKIGPFIINKNSEGIKYCEINKLKDNLEFKNIKKINN